MDRNNKRLCFRLVFIAFSYFAANKIALLVPDADKVLTAVWPASGVGLAALLLNPRRFWPAILIAIFIAGNAANFISGRPMTNSLGFMTVNVLESLLCAFLLTNFCGNNIRFERVKEVVFLILGAVGVNAITALFGAIVAYVTSLSTFWIFWQTWWVADGLGILLVTPAILAWSRVKISLSDLRNQRFLESLVFLGIWSFISWSTFQVHKEHTIFTPQPYILIPLLCWPALRLMQRTLSLSLIILSFIVLTTNQLEHFIPIFRNSGDSTTAILIAQEYILFTSIVAFLTIAVMSERTNANKLLTASNRRYSLLIENSMDAIFLADMSGRLIDTNPEAERQTGISKDELLRLSILDIDALQTQENFIKFIPELLHNGRTTLETLHRTKNGGLMPVDLRISAVCEGDETFILGFARDITDRKRMEDLLKESEVKFRTVADFTHDWEYWLGTDGQMIWMSPSCEKITGYTPEEFFLDTMLLQQIVHIDDKIAFNNHLLDITRDHPAPCDIDFRIIHKSGNAVWLNHKCMSIFSSNGTPLGRRTSNRDITDRKKNGNGA